jgi:pimeloyl-ACP methyl ester carboxylesterase
MSIGRAALGRKAFRNLSKSRLEQVRANMIKAKFTGSVFPSLYDSQLRELRIPTLLVNGQKSPGLFHHLINRFRELLPDAECVQINGASHIVHEHNLTEYNSAVMSFLRKYPCA